VSWNPSPQPLDPGGAPAGVFHRPQPKRRLWLHVLLFLLTIASSTFCGGLYYGWLPSPDPFERVLDPALWFEGLKFSLPLLFSPGTLGAVIRIKEPIRTRRQLLDVGAWGPIAGFLALLPFLVAGTALSGVQEVDPEATGFYFGEPILFRLVARGLFFPDLAFGEDIMVHPTAWAAWFGLFVTALNMLPFFQLDGGHVSYALFGRHHRRAAWPLLGVLAALGILWPGWWVWAVVLALLGPRHPPVLDEDAPLDRRHRIIGWCALLILALSFSPRPIWVGAP